MGWITQGRHTNEECGNCGKTWGKHSASSANWCPPIFGKYGQWAEVGAIKRMEFSHESRPLPVVEFTPDLIKPIKGNK